jgi:acetyl esterase/lipase
VAVLIHGGFWRARYGRELENCLVRDLVVRGWAVWNIEYRRLGDGGGWPTTFEDVRAAISALPLAGERVVAIGHSAGGQLALLAGSRTTVPLRAVVSLAGVVDPHETDRSGDDHGLIARLLGGGPDAVPERWREASPRAQVPLGIRYVLACGTADVHWEPNKATAEAARLAGDDVELLPLSDAGHFELVDPAAPEWAIIRARIQDLL